VIVSHLSGTDLYKGMPKGGVGESRLQVCFFSATLHSPEIKNLSEKICYQPQWVDLKGMDSVPETVHHVVVRVNSKVNKSWSTPVKGVITDGIHKKDKTGVEIDSPESLSEGVKLLKPVILKEVIDSLKIDYAMIFCRTNVDCFNLEKYMISISDGWGGFKGEKEKGKENKYSCCVLSGMRSNADRSEALQAFKDGLVRFLICTDVAARGIDVKGLPYVINFTLPDKAENYIHRIGRVGRAECMGLAISIVSEVKEKVWYHANCKSNNRGGGKGSDCYNTALVENKGCAIWYDELGLLGEVESRLKETIETMEEGYKVSVPPPFDLHQAHL
jgi:ATP-dependent RNA helicase DDX1